MAVSGIWIWRRKPALSPRQWAGMLAVTTLGFLIIGGAVVAYAYMRGARGTFADVVWASSIGAVASYGVPLGLLALGGYVRALIVRRRL